MRTHFFLALSLGIFFRLLAIYNVWGPQALDDYLDNLIPAWKHLVGLEPDLHNYRSPLYLWILSFWLKLGQTLTIEQPLAQIRWVQLLQALSSLLTPVSAYLLFRKKANTLIPIIAVYLTSLHGLLPFATTRIFMESFVLGPISLGLVLLWMADQDKRQKFFMLAGFSLLGFASLVRFQSGIIYVAWLLLMVVTQNKQQVLFAFLTGFVLVGLEALIDIGYGRYAFQTLYDYFDFNRDQHKSGIMPWYNTFLTLAGMIYLPFAFLLGRQWIKSCQQYWKLLFPIAVYFLVHTLNPHKEERYLYPILGIVLMLWAVAWAESWSLRKVKFIYNPLFLLFNSLILFAGCFINTQVSLVGPLAVLQSQAKGILVLDHDSINMRSNMAEFFIRQPSRYQIQTQPPNAEVTLQEFAKFPELEAVGLLSVRKENEKALLETKEKLSLQFLCSDVFEATSLSDRILYSLRPERNERRQPTKYFLCKRKK